MAFTALTDNNNDNNSIGQLIFDVPQRNKSVWSADKEEAELMAEDIRTVGVGRRRGGGGGCRANWHVDASTRLVTPLARCPGGVSLRIPSHLRRACPCHAPGCRGQTVFPFPPSVPAARGHVPPLSPSHLGSAV